MDAKERFKKIGDKLIKEGKLFPCPYCNCLRDIGLCLGCTKEICDICTKFAGFETSPEGQVCEVCDKWICKDCATSPKRNDDSLLCVCKECLIGG